MKTTIIATLILLSAATVAFSNGDRPDARRQRELGQVLQLTPSQQAAWERAHNEFRATTHALIEKRTALGRQAEAALKEKSPDACAVGRMTVSLQGFNDQIRSEENTLQQRLQSMLSSEQRIKYEAFRAGQQFERTADSGD